MFKKRRVALGPLVLLSSVALAGCPGVLPTGTSDATSGPAPGGSGGTTVVGTTASSAPQPFGSPNFPVPKPILPPPASQAPATPTPAPSATATASPTPVPTGSPLVVAPQAETPLSYYVKPTLGQLVFSYYKDGGQDQNGQTVKLQDLTGIVTDAQGDRFFTDSGNNAIRVLLETTNPDGSVTKVLQTVATKTAEVGTDGKAIPLRTPRGITIGNIGASTNQGIYVVDTGNQAIRYSPIGTDSSSTSFTTLAGGGAAGYADFTGKLAQFNNPYGIAVDTAGNAYVTDTNNHCIRKITPAQVVTTLAGNGSPGNADGTGKSASFSSPTGIAIDPKGVLYVADTGNNVIRKITPDGVVTTFAGSGVAGFKNALGKAAQFNAPIGISVDNTGTVFVSERGSQEMRKILPTGAVTTLAGTDDLLPGLIDGPGPTARFSDPRGVFVDTTGIVWVIDAGNNGIRQVQPVHAMTTFAGRGRPMGTTPFANNVPLFPPNSTCCIGATTAGFVDGDAYTAQFNEPWAVAVDDAYNLYVADSANHAIRKVAPDGTVTTLAGNGKPGFSDGKGNRAQFNTPRAIAIDGAGNLIVADQLNNCIRRVTPDGSVSTIAGDVEPTHAPGLKNGGVDVATFNNPDGVAIDASGNVYISDRGNHVIRKLTPYGQVSTFAGDGTAGYKDVPSNALATAEFSSPAGLAFDAKGTLYVADYGNNCIRVIPADGSRVGTLAGSQVPSWADAAGANAGFNGPWSMTVDDDGLVYVADYGNSVIRRIDGTGATVTYIGDLPGYPTNVPPAPLSGYADGSAYNAALSAPAGICIDKRGFLYVADTKNHRIRKIW